MSETLAVRGRRLQETALQRQGKVYDSDVFLSVEVDTGDGKLEAGFDNYLPLTAAYGEQIHLSVQLVNIGTKDISEIWLVHGRFDVLCLSDKSELASGNENNLIAGSLVDAVEVSEIQTSGQSAERIISRNSISAPDPVKLPLEKLHGSPILSPSDVTDVPLILHANEVGEQDLCLMLIFREVRVLAHVRLGRERFFSFRTDWLFGFPSKCSALHLVIVYEKTLVLSPEL